MQQIKIVEHNVWLKFFYFLMIDTFLLVYLLMHGWKFSHVGHFSYVKFFTLLRKNSAVANEKTNCTLYCTITLHTRHNYKLFLKGRILRIFFEILLNTQELSNVENN